VIFGVIGLLFFIGLYALVFSRNVIRLLIGLEIMIKAVTLALVSSASGTQSPALGQTFFVTLLVIEVIVAIIFLAFVINVYSHTESLDIRKLTQLRG